MKEKMITVPIRATWDASGNMVYEYRTIPLNVFEAWIKHCYELSGEH